MVPADSWRSSPTGPGSGPGLWGRGARAEGGLATAGDSEGGGATDTQATLSGAGGWPRHHRSSLDLAHCRL